jgi:hypothetical protein
MTRLAQALRFLRLPVIGQLPSLQIDGNTADASSLQAYLNSLARASAPMVLPINASVVTNASTTAETLTPANCANGIINAIVVASGGSVNTNTTDTATNIINGYWPNAYVGATALLNLVNLNSGTTTLAGGTGVTITGTATTVTAAQSLWQAVITNLANPALRGAASTNSTTTSAAVANNAGVNNPTSVINVASATGINANASWLQVVNTDGSTSNYSVTAVNTLAITVAGNIAKNIASGAAVSVFNNTITFTRLYSTVTAVLAA